MPPRSNDFQTVVLMIKNHLAGDAKVTESAMLPALDTGQLREVDVVIEVEAAGHKVLIGVECRDHARKQLIGWIEEMHSKHILLPTHSVVLVSSKGFTETAKARAALYGMELITPAELTEDRAGKIVNNLRSLWFKQLKTNLQKVFVTIGPGAHGTAGSLEVKPNTAVFLETGTEVGVMDQVVSSIVRNLDLTAVMRDALEDVTHYTAGADPLEIPVGDQKVSLYLRWEGAESHLVKIESVEVTGDAEVVVSEFPLTHRDFNGTAYSYGKSKFGELDALMVVTEADDGSGAISVKFS